MLARLLGPRLARALGWSVCLCVPVFLGKVAPHHDESGEAVASDMSLGSVSTLCSHACFCRLHLCLQAALP